MRQETLGSALSTARELSAIPNAPFLYKPALEFIKNSEILKSPRVKTAENIFAFYANIKEGNPSRKIIVTTHLDHPFVILDGKGQGIPFGSVPPEFLNKTNVKIYSKEGVFIAKGQINNPKHTGKRNYVEVIGPNHSPNSHAIWDLETPFETNAGRVLMLAADDVVTTAVVLEAIRVICNSPIPLDVDITFAFTKVEEVRQISATGISLLRRTPFGVITPNDLIFPLEADRVDTCPIHSEVSRSTGIALPHQDKGIIIKTSNLEVVLGQELKGEQNDAENVILNMTDKNSINVQSCVSAGVDDGTAFTIFPTSPHIATLSIPNPNKHNFDGSLSPVHENIALNDVNSLLMLLISLGTKKLDDRPHNKSTSQKLKSSLLKADSSTITRLRKEHLRVLISSLPHLKFAKFFPETPFEFSINLLASALAYSTALIAK